MTGPQDPAPAAGDRLRVGYADRDQVIEVLKDAFVQGRLTRDELDARAGRALAARTYADLAALTADMPLVPDAARPERPPALARRRPLARAAAKSGICLTIAAAAVWAAFLADPGSVTPIPPGLCFVVAIYAVIAAVCIMGYGVAKSVEQRRSRKQLPPRPGLGGHGLEAEQCSGTGHDPVPPGPRTDQTRADLRTHISWPQRSSSSGRGARAPRGVRPVPDAG
jgi:hypothetical protein